MKHPSHDNLNMYVCYSYDLMKSPNFFSAMKLNDRFDSEMFTFYNNLFSWSHLRQNHPTCRWYKLHLWRLKDKGRCKSWTNTISYFDPDSQFWPSVHDVDNDGVIIVQYYIRWTRYCAFSCFFAVKNWIKTLLWTTIRKEFKTCKKRIIISVSLINEYEIHSIVSNNNPWIRCSFCWVFSHSF